MGPSEENPVSLPPVPVPPPPIFIGVAEPLLFWHLRGAGAAGVFCSEPEPEHGARNVSGGGGAEGARAPPLEVVGPCEARSL